FALRRPILVESEVGRPRYDVQLLPLAGNRLEGLGCEIPVRVVVSLGDADQSRRRDQSWEEGADAVGEQHLRRGCRRSPVISRRLCLLQPREGRPAVRERERSDFADLGGLMVDIGVLRCFEETCACLSQRSLENTEANGSVAQSEIVPAI